MDKHDRQRALGAMNAFDRARAKHENKTKPQVPPVVAEVPAPLPVETAPVPVPVSEEKPKRKEAVFDVRVYLPDGEIVFVLTKQNIYENVPRSKVTAHELKKAMAVGLEALMGRVQ